MCAAEPQAETAAVERDGVWQSELAQAQAALSELRSTNANLRSQLEEATASSAAVADPTGQLAALQQRLAESQACVAKLQAQLDDRRVLEQQGSSHVETGQSSADGGRDGGGQVEALRAELEALRQTAESAVLERERTRAQLSRSLVASHQCLTSAMPPTRQSRR